MTEPSEPAQILREELDYVEREVDRLRARIVVLEEAVDIGRRLHIAAVTYGDMDQHPEIPHHRRASCAWCLAMEKLSQQ